MYDFFYGKVVSISESYIVLEISNIGYKIYICNSKDIKLNYYVKIFIYNHISDSIIELYGFKTKLERDIFIKLLEIPKIGVKSAYLILKKYTVEDLLNIVASKDEDLILKINKITKNNVKELIQKLSKFKYENSININIEFLSILRSLEYNDYDIFKIYKQIDTTKDMNTQIKQAIKLLEALKYE